MPYSPGTMIRFQVDTNQRVAIQSARNLAPVLDLQFPVDEPYARMFGRWVVACVDQKITMIESPSTNEEDKIIISFQQPDVTVQITRRIQTGMVQKRIQQVRQIEVYPRKVGKIKVQTGESVPNTGHSVEVPPPEQQHRQVRENNQVRENSREQQNHPIQQNHQVQQNDELVNRLKAELEQERQTNQQLQKLVNVRLEQALDAAAQQRECLDAAGRQTLSEYEASMARNADEITRREQKIAQCTQTLEAQRQQLESQQRQLDDLTQQSELVNLDCEQAQRQLEELQAQWNMDQESMTLLEESGRLKHGSVLRSLQAMQEELDKVEKRIAAIIRYRSRFNQAVEETIFNGDGTILTTEEAGGNADGDGSTAAPEDERAPV